MLELQLGVIDSDVTYLTALEVAHQWWGHQVIGADVQGSSMLSETLAQYSALMVMKRLYGEHEVRRFLRFELERYLSGRGKGMVGELPLARVEDQPYIHCQKGSLIRAPGRSTRQTSCGRCREVGEGGRREPRGRALRGRRERAALRGHTPALAAARGLHQQTHRVTGQCVAFAHAVQFIG